MRVRVGLGLGLGRGDGVRAGVVTSGLVRLLAVILARLGEGACSDPLLAWLGLGIGIGVGCRDRTRVRDSVRVGVGVRVRDGDPLLAFALPLRDPFAYARVPFLVRGRGRGRVRVWVRVWVRVRVTGYVAQGPEVIGARRAACGDHLGHGREAECARRAQAAHLGLGLGSGLGLGLA